MKKNMKNTVKWGDFGQAVVYQKKALIKQEV